MKRSLMNYRGDTNVPFIKITVQDQRNLPKARDKFLSWLFFVAESLISLDVHASSRGKHSNFGTFRSDRPHTRAIFLTPYDS